MKFFKSVFLPLFFLVLMSTGRAQQGWPDFSARKNVWWSYVSPGVRLEYTFDEGFTWSAEVTLGLFNNNSSKFYSVALGYQHIPNSPTSFTYVALQGGQLFGLSVGRVFYKDKGIRQQGWRLSGFGGLALGFLSYDQLILPSLSAKYHTVSVWGKLPLPLTVINENIGSVEF